MYLKNSQHIQVQDMTCSEAGDAVMGFIEEELIKPLIVNDLIELDKIKLLSALGGAIQILTEKSIGKFISNIDEMKTGIRTVKMTGQEQNEGERIETSAKSIKSNTFKLMRTHAPDS